MRRLTQSIRDVFSDKEVMKRLYAVTLGAALLILVLCVRGPESRGTLLTDSDGNVVGIRRHDIRTTEQYDVSLRIIDGADITDKDLTLVIRAAGENKVKAASGPDKAERRKAEIQAEIDSMLADIEYSDEEEISLPASLQDGTPVIWSMRRQSDNSGMIIIPVMYVLLVITIIASSMKSGRDEEAQDREAVMKGLPRFCNQLFLMMNAGMILSDAFEKICTDYSKYRGEDLDPFERELAEIYAEDTDRRISTATMINELAARHNVKELVRIAAILTENEKRGSNVSAELERESKYLWDDRKIVARECGRMIDTRMSLPLSLLLIILIVITMAPALMNM